MYKLIFFSVAVLFNLSISAQDINGVWEGRIIRPTDFNRESGTIFKQGDCRLVLDQKGTILTSLFTLKDSIGETALRLETGMSGFLPKTKGNSIIELFRDPKIDRKIPGNDTLTQTIAYTNYINANQIEKDGRIYLIGTYATKLNDIAFGPFTSGYFVVEKTADPITKMERNFLGSIKPSNTPKKSLLVSDFKEINFREQFILLMALAYNKGKIILE